MINYFWLFIGQQVAGFTFPKILLFKIPDTSLSPAKAGHKVLYTIKRSPEDTYTKKICTQNRAR